MGKVFAITGGIGAGKSEVAKILRSFGYLVLEADAMAKSVMHSYEFKSSIISILGAESFNPDGELNKNYIRNKLFSNSSLKESLEALIHPQVHNMLTEIKSNFFTISPNGWIFFEHPLLFEKNSQKEFDAAIFIDVPLHLREERVLSSRNITKEDFHAIVNSQLSDSYKRDRADFTIDNSGDTCHLSSNVLLLIKSLSL